VRGGSHHIYLNLRSRRLSELGGHPGVAQALQTTQIGYGKLRVVEASEGALSIISLAGLEAF